MGADQRHGQCQRHGAWCTAGRLRRCLARHQHRLRARLPCVVEQQPARAGAERQRLDGGPGRGGARGAGGEVACNPILILLLRAREGRRRLLPRYSGAPVLKPLGLEIAASCSDLGAEGPPLINAYWGPASWRASESRSTSPRQASHRWYQRKPLRPIERIASPPSTSVASITASRWVSKRRRSVPSSAFQRMSKASSPQVNNNRPASNSRNPLGR